MTSLTYDDPRNADRYEIEVSSSGTFLFATRYIDDPLGRDPVFYERLGDIPQPHRNEIRQLIWTKWRNV